MGAGTSYLQGMYSQARRRRPIRGANTRFVSVGVTALGLVAVALLAACPAQRPTTARGSRQVADVVAALAVPPSPSAAQDLAWLASRTDLDRGPAQAAHLEYLVALFDDARFAKSTQSRQVLLSALALPLETSAGPALTAKVLDALEGLAQRTLVATRTASAEVQQRTLQLHTLITFDRVRPTSRDDVIGWLAPLKALTEAPGMIGAAARLRRFGVCAEALAAAIRGSERDRLQRAAFCLYANHAADPAPFFEPEPLRRPPPPRWRDLAADASAQLRGKPAYEVHPWMASAVAQALEAFDGWIATHLEDLPTPLLERGFEVPSVDSSGIAPYDFSPVAIVGTDPARNSEAVAALANPLIGDGRGVVALAAPPNLDSALLMQAAQAAADITAASLEIVVAVVRPLRRDEGSYWAAHASSEQVRTAGALRVSLFKLWRSDDSVRATDWDPDRATLGLHLLVEPRRWILVGEAGVVAAVDLALDEEGSPVFPPAAETLRGRVRELLAAYRRERGVIVRPGDATTVASLVAAIAAVQHDRDGGPLLDHVAIDAAPFAARGTDLASRIDRRLRATVTSENLSASSRQAVLDCYRAALDNKPALASAMRFERDRSGGWRRVRGDRDPALGACIAAELADTFRLADIKRIDLGLQLRPPTAQRQ